MAGTTATAAAARDGAEPLALLVALDPARGEPLRRQLAGELREAIRAGRLRTGVRLPASRALAAQLGVSRGVVTDAYEQLTAEGWLAARRGAGTVVAAGPGRRAAAARGRRARAAVRFDFTPTTPDVSLFPRRPWARAVARAAAEAPDAELDYGSGLGSRALREALAGYLGRVRGTAAEPGGHRRLRRLQPGDAAALRACSPSAACAASRSRTRRSPTTGTPRAHAGLEPVPVAARRRGPARRRARGLGRGGRRRHAEPPVPDRRGDGARAPPRAARVGARRRPARDRGRLRRRVPLRPPPARRAAGARPRARRVRRHGVEDARARAAARLDRSRPPRSRPRSRPRSSPPTPARPRSTSSRSRT